MNKKLKKIGKITGFTLLVLIAAAFLIPLLFKKQITELVKKEINNNLIAVSYTHLLMAIAGKLLLATPV